MNAATKGPMLPVLSPQEQEAAARRHAVRSAELLEAVALLARPLEHVVGAASDLRNGTTDAESDELLALIRLALPRLATAVQAARDEIDDVDCILEFAAAAVALLAETAPGSLAREAGLAPEWLADGAFGMLQRIRTTAATPA